MQDNDTLKYTALGLVAAGLAFAFMGGGTFARILLIGGILVLGWILKIEGVGGGGSGSRRAAICAQVAFVLLAFALPYEFMVRPVLLDATVMQRRAAQAEGDLKGYRIGLAELESREHVQVSTGGLEREVRRNLAIEQDIDTLRAQLEFAKPIGDGASEDGEAPPAVSASDALEELTRRVDAAKSRLNDKKRQRASRGENIDFAKEQRLGFDAVPDPTAAQLALDELPLVEAAIDRAIESGIRVVEKIEIGELVPEGHDIAPQIDVATRTVAIEVRTTLEALARYLHLLQTMTPYLGIKSVDVPARQVKDGRAMKEDKEEKITGDLVSARITIQSFVANVGGLADDASPAPGEAVPEEAGKPRKWFR